MATIPIGLVIYMKLSLRSEYALLTLVQLARHPQPIPETALVSVLKISIEALTEILAVLGGKGYVAQLDGRVQLAKDAGEISVAEIIRLFDGVLAPLEPVSSKGYAPAPMDNEVKLAGLFEDIQEQISTRLENTTLSELV